MVVGKRSRNETATKSTTEASATKNDDNGNGNNNPVRKVKGEMNFSLCIYLEPVVDDNYILGHDSILFV